MSFTARLSIARLLYLVAEKDLRERFCSCRRPIDRFVTPEIQAAMDAVERELANEPTTE